MNQTRSGHKSPSEKIDPDNATTDALLHQNEEIIHKLHLKIGRRLDIGYYCDVPNNSRNLIFPARKRSPSKPSPPARKHHVFKKPKRIDKPEMVDYEQNTSGVFVQYQARPEVQDQNWQWEYSPQEVDEQIQYTLESELIQCQDASIQYSFQEEPVLPSPELIDAIAQTATLEAPQQSDYSLSEKSVQVNQALKEAQTQRQQQKRDYVDHMIQIDIAEQKPSVEQKLIQIDIPDEQQERHIISMKSQIQALQREKVVRQKSHKEVKGAIEILKLKQQLLHLQKQINLAESKEVLQMQRRQKEEELQLRQRQYQKQKVILKKKCMQQTNERINSTLNEFVDRMKQMSERPRIDRKGVEEQKKREEQNQRKDRQEKEDLEKGRRNVKQLKQQLKKEMFSRLKYEDDSESIDQFPIYERKSSLGYIQYTANRSVPITSIKELFPSVLLEKKRYAGAIIKNRQHNPEDALQVNEQAYRTQKQLCPLQQQGSMLSSATTRAYWRQRSVFAYKFSDEIEARHNRKIKYQQKIEQSLKIPRQQKLNSSPQFSSLSNPTGRVSLIKLKDRDKYPIRYNYQWTAGNNNLDFFGIKAKIESFFGNPTYFKYLYGEPNKIMAGYQLFSIFNISIEEPKCIKIIRFSKHFVFSYKQNQSHHFIVVSNDKKSLFYSALVAQTQPSTISYSAESEFKNFWGYDYINSKEVYCGEFTKGRRQGFGIHFDGLTFYKGGFIDNKRQGRGQLTFQNKDRYQGGFANNLFQGEGTYFWANGQIYEGFFKEGLKQGYGKHSFANGDCYHGFYFQNKKQGKGKYLWHDGSCYEGEFFNDMKNGYGQQSKLDDKKLVGFWQNDVLIRTWDQLITSREAAIQLPLLKKNRLK